MATEQGHGENTLAGRPAVQDSPTSPQDIELRSNRSGLSAEHPGSSGRGGTLPEEGEKFSQPKPDAWGRMAGATSKAAVREQERRRIERETYRPGFYRYSEGVAKGLYTLAYIDDRRDDLMIGLYHVDGGCCRFEFRVETIVVGSGTAIRLAIFSDAFEALREFRDLFQWMGKFQPKTLDDVQTWLTENGFVNCIAGDKPGAVRG